MIFSCLFVFCPPLIASFTNSNPIWCTPLCINYVYVVFIIGIIRDDKDKFKCLYLLVETAVAVRQREKEQEDVPVLGNWEAALWTPIRQPPTPHPNPCPSRVSFKTRDVTDLYRSVRRENPFSEWPERKIYEIDIIYALINHPNWRTGHNYTQLLHGN